MLFFAKRIKNLFKNFDLFGQPILLSFKGKTLYKTWTGGFLSLILVSTMLAFSFEAIISLILREDISVSYSQIYESNPPLVELSADKGFLLAVGFSLDFLNNPSKKYFDLQVLNNRIMRLENGTRISKKEEIKFKICEQSDFPRDYDYQKNGNNNFLCLEKNQTLILSGKYFGSLLEYTQFIIRRCQNTTLKNDCASTQEMDNLLNTTFYFNFLISNKILNLKNHSNPIINYINSEVFFLVDPKKYRQADIFFQKNTISYDDNIWFYRSRDSTEITYLNFREQATESMRTEVAIFYLRSNYMVGNYVATSEKITFMLSRIGGLMSMIYAFLIFLIRPYARRKLLVSLSNYLYKFFNDQKEEERKNNDMTPTLEAETVNHTTKHEEGFDANAKKNIFKWDKPRGEIDTNGIELCPITETIPDSPSNKKSLINYIPRKPPDEAIALDGFTSKELNVVLGLQHDDTISYLNGKDKELLREIQKETTPIKFSFLDFIGLKVRKLFKRQPSLKANLLKAAKRNVKKELYIINILHRLQELEKLKVLLLSPDQQDMLSLLEKPIISIDKKPKIDDSTHLRKVSSMEFSQRMDRLKFMWESNKMDHSVVKGTVYESGFKYYKKLKNNDEKSEIDERLLCFVEERMKIIQRNMVKLKKK